VAHFCDSHPGRADGVSRSAGLTVALLAEAGHEVHYCRPGPLLGRRAAGEMRSVPVPFRQIRVGLPWGRVPATGPLDLVHVHTTGPIGMAGFRLAESRRVPLVVTWHTDLLAYADHFVEIPLGAAWCALRLRLGWTVREHLELARAGGVRHRRLLALGRGMLDRTAVIIAPSAKTAAGLAEFGRLPEVRVLPTPVVPPAAGPVAPGLPAGAPIVLSVGRVSREKNPALLVRAFAKVLAARPQARLVMVGVQRNGRAVRREAAALGIADRVMLVPPVPHEAVGGYYRAADVLAFPSSTDTQSLVLSEAESVGLPVVVADRELAARPGAPQPGRVTCESTPDAFADALLRMLDDADLRRRTGQAGLAAAAAYPPERYLSLLLATYEQALDMRTGAGASRRPPPELRRLRE
jgi:glycosyltransferase involved in cell wall biosynthesis